MGTGPLDLADLLGLAGLLGRLGRLDLAGLLGLEGPLGRLDLADLLGPADLRQDKGTQCLSQFRKSNHLSVSLQLQHFLLQ